MVNIVRGSLTKPVSTEKLIKFFQDKREIEGTLYLGYPIIGTVEGAYHLDAVLVSKEHGVIVFDIIEGVKLDDRQEIQDDVCNKLTSKLYQNKKLVSKRKLMVDIDAVTYAPAVSVRGEPQFNLVVDDSELNAFLDDHQWDENTYYPFLVAAIQSVTKIKNIPKRENVSKPNSRGAKLKTLEESIANLDTQQSQAVIETVEGPQRIRGLAGSGKTIVLALKTAYLHSKHPDWIIGVTFNSRALKTQFIDLITRFTFDHKGDKPDWTKVRIIHAWGSPNSTGIYYEVCKDHNIEYFDFSSAKFSLNHYNGSEFDKVCQKALESISDYKQTFDAILIDEAQDFAESFLNLCYNILKPPKRLIYAYDELQKLNEESMRGPEEIFGVDENGHPRVQLKNQSDGPREDIILQKCYRNSRPVLVSAHALGFGIYRDPVLVQMFDNPTLWKEIGYAVEEGNLSLGNHVILARTPETSPPFLENHSSIDDLFICKCFQNNSDQINWIADQIETNLNQDELEHNDIVVIHCDPYRTKSATGPLRNMLFKKNINSHLVGVDTSPDGFFQDKSVTFTSIYRAKGNEAPMIYVMDAQYCYGGTELIKKRNILFTALTRSKAWVRFCGYGQDMQKLAGEFESVKQKDFKLDFLYPSEKQMRKLNIIHRDKTKTEEKSIKDTEKTLGEFVKALHEGRLYMEDISPEVLKALKKELKKYETNLE